MATETKADSSVVMALSELVRMEQDRIESDREREARRALEARAERERAEAERREAERREAERAAREAKVAEAEARLRLEADRERDQRIAAMRAELARVEAERGALRADLESRLGKSEPARPNGWALAFGLSSLVAASLAGLLVVQGAQGAAQPVATLEVRAPASAPATEPVAAPVQSARVEAPPVPETATVATSAAPRGHHHHVRTQTDATTTTTGHATDLVGLDIDEGSDDVLGPDLARDAHRSLEH